MGKRFIKNVNDHAVMYRDDRNGITWIENGSTGMGHSCHPNIFSNGSVRGMKKIGYWGIKDRTVRSHGYIYNIDRFTIDTEDTLDKIIADNCMCQACIERRGENKLC